MLTEIKEKSWSVLLVKGNVFNEEVKGERCINCNSTAQALVVNYNNPNLMLYACKDGKCKHRFLRLNFKDDLIEEQNTNKIDV